MSVTITSAIRTLDEVKRNKTDDLFNSLSLNDLGEQTEPLTMTYDTLQGSNILLSNGQTLATSGDLSIYREIGNTTFENPCELYINKANVGGATIGIDSLDNKFKITYDTQVYNNQIVLSSDGINVAGNLWVGENAATGDSPGSFAGFSAKAEGDIIYTNSKVTPSGRASIQTSSVFLPVGSAEKLQLIPLNNYRPKITDDQGIQLGQVSYIGDSFLYSDNTYTAITWITSAAEVTNEINLYKIIRLEPLVNNEGYTVDTTLFENVKKIRLFNVNEINHKSVITLKGVNFDLNAGEGITFLYVPNWTNNIKKYDFIY